MEPTDFLNAQLIKEMLSPDSIGSISKLLVLGEVDSTNSQVMRELKSGEGSAVVCAAERQTAGRGRAGRAWFSPSASNIYLSLSWEYYSPSTKLEGLSLAVGVVILNSLSTLGYTGLRLKWPNDILVKGAKLAGVLVEVTMSSNTSVQVIVGVGINVRMSREQGSQIERSWTDLSTIREEPPPSRNHLIAIIIDELLDLLSSFDTRGFCYWRDDWHAKDDYLNKQVEVLSGTENFSGISRGVDSSGALVLESPEGFVYVSAGDMSLRGV